MTRSLNQLKDDLKKLEGDAAQQAQSGNSDDKGQVATQQALNQAGRVRQGIEQLTRSREGQQPGQKPGQGKPGQGQQQGDQQGQGQQQGKQGQQGGQQGQGQGQQPGGQQAGQQPGQGQQGQGQQSQGQQGQGGQQGGQRAGMGSQAGGSPNGGGLGVNNGPFTGRNNIGDDRNFRDQGMQPVPQINQEAAYSDLMRDIGRLRAAAGDDKDLAREVGDLQRKAQELDPRHSNNDGQLGAVINSQVLSEIDQVELILRKKLQANDGSVRSTRPRTTAPGYADAVAEYYKRLSKQ